MIQMYDMSPDNQIHRQNVAMKDQLQRKEKELESLRRDALTSAEESRCVERTLIVS
jgi:hypothetical protein